MIDWDQTVRSITMSLSGSLSLQESKKKTPRCLFYMWQNFNWFLYRHRGYCFSAITLRWFQFEPKKVCPLCKSHPVALSASVEILDPFLTISNGSPSSLLRKTIKAFVQVLDQILPWSCSPPACRDLQPASVINRSGDQRLKAASISSCAPHQRPDRSSTPINSGTNILSTSAEVSGPWALTRHHSCLQ